MPAAGANYITRAFIQQLFPMACRPAGELELEEVEFLAEEVADAKVTCREDTLSIIEDITVRLLEELVAGEPPTLHLVRNTMNLNRVPLYVFRYLGRKEM